MSICKDQYDKIYSLDSEFNLNLAVLSAISHLLVTSPSFPKSSGFTGIIDLETTASQEYLMLSNLGMSSRLSLYSRYISSETKVSPAGQINPKIAKRFPAGTNSYRANR